jgi:hypothetical protein
MGWTIAGSYFETCSCDVVCPCATLLSLGAGSELTVLRATRSSINAFRIPHAAKAGFSASEFSWAA